MAVLLSGLVGGATWGKAALGKASLSSHPPRAPLTALGQRCSDEKLRPGAEASGRSYDIPTDSRELIEPDDRH